MPVDPGDAAELGRGVSAVLAEAEARLIELVGSTLAQGIDGPDWDQQALMRVQALQQRLRPVLKTMEDAADDEIQRAILDAWQAGADTATADLEALTTPVLQGPQLREAALIGTENLVREAKQSIGQVAVQAAFRSGRVYSETARQVIAEATVGAGVNRRDLAARYLQRLTAKGVTGFTDKAGRNWDMNSYAEMVTRTTTAQALVSGHVDQLADSRQDLVMVSDAPAECERCRPFEGKILSIGGPPGTRDIEGHEVRVLTTVEDARRRGLFHPNCRHRLVSYLPGITRPLVDTEDPEGDRLRQQQRAWERSIRKARREVDIREQLNGKNSPAAVQARAALRGRQKDFKAFRDANGLKDLNYRTQLDIGNRKVKAPDRAPLQGPQDIGTRTPAPARRASVVQPRKVIPDENLPTRRRGKRTPPADMRDWNKQELRDAGDDELDQALTAAFEDDHPGADRIIAEIDRREEALNRARARAEIRAEAERLRPIRAAEARAARREAEWEARQARISRLISDGMDPREAVEEVTGVTVEKQLRAELMAELRNTPGKTLDQKIRFEYRQEVDRLYVEAEDYCRGTMLSREAENLNTIAREKGKPDAVDPGKFFANGNEAYTRRWASKELREWFDLFGRPTFEEYKHQRITGPASHGRPVDDFLT